LCPERTDLGWPDGQFQGLTPGRRARNRLPTEARIGIHLLPVFGVTRFFGVKLMMPSEALHPLGRPQRFSRVRELIRSVWPLVCMVILVVFLSGCPNKTPVAKTPAPPPPPAPVAILEASAASVQAGQSVTLTWKTENAVEVTLDPLGPVQMAGSQTVAPTESTTYRLVARGPGGVKESNATVAVTSATVEKQPTAEEVELETAGGRLDVFFDTDDSSIRADQTDTIKNDVAFLKRHPEVRISIEGHCDEPGSTEYNLALGEERAAEVRAALEKGGINVARIQTISYGKERPFCEEQTDACWRQNRRAHINPHVDQ
jgi:peptidoglycan-associated lipoprotein